MGLFSSETIVTPSIVSPTISGATLTTATLTAPTLNQPNTVGVTGASNAAAGSVGEFVSALVAVGSAVSLTTATAKNVASISLTAGDWDVEGNVNFTGGSATTAAGGLFSTGISTSTGALPTDGSEVPVAVPPVTTTSFLANGTLPRKRISISSTTTVYLVAEATFSAGTVGAYGAITARRER